MSVSVIIVNWHSKDYLSQCLRSLERTNCGEALEVIVIDAGSYDGCQEYLAHHHPQVTFIQHPLNCGFAKANNLAAARATREYLLFLNPDTDLVTPAVQQLRAAVQTCERAGIVGPRLLNADGTLQTTCVLGFPSIVSEMLNSDLLRQRFPRFPLWRNAAVHSPASNPQPVDAVSGACMMMSSALYRELGGFSEEYFMYGEDVDIAFRSQALGYATYHVPDAVVRHYGGTSSDRAPGRFAAVMLKEATWRYMRRTRGRAYGAAYRTAMGIVAVLRLAVLGGWAAFPVASRASTLESLKKWVAILGWSIRRDATVRQYYGS